MYAGSSLRPIMLLPEAIQHCFPRSRRRATGRSALVHRGTYERYWELNILQAETNGGSSRKEVEMGGEQTGAPREQAGVEGEPTGAAGYSENGSEGDTFSCERRFLPLLVYLGRCTPYSSYLICIIITWVPGYSKFNSPFHYTYPGTYWMNVQQHSPTLLPNLRHLPEPVYLIYTYLVFKECKYLRYYIIPWHRYVRSRPWLRVKYIRHVCV